MPKRKGDAPILRTRFPELGIQNQGVRNWRYIDTSTGQAIGPSYNSKIEAFSDLQRYAEEFGLLRSNPSRRKYGKRAGEFVREEMHSLKHGSKHIRSREQAIAAGLSRARAAGVRVPLSNPSEMFTVGVSYDVVTEESAEQGDFEETGWEHEPEEMTLRDALHLIERYGPFDTGWHASPGMSQIALYQADGETDIRTGDVTRYAVHIRSTPHNLQRLIAFLRKKRLLD